MRIALAWAAAAVGGALCVQADAAGGAEALVTSKSLSPELALELAGAALKSCQDRGYQAAVAVTDRGGVPLVMLRDRFAGPHTPDTATRKAWTAVTFKTTTAALIEIAKPGMPQEGVRFIAGAILIGGGVPVEAAGSIVGGIGVSGGPGGEADEACARAGLARIQDRLDFN